VNTSEDVLSTAFCGGCGPAVRQECQGSLKRLGCFKVHWECWSECNLACQFCYRTRGVPLQTSEAELLLAAVAVAGARTIVFAGGDPSLRRDIGHLLDWARQLHLTTEVQTNAQHAPAVFRQALMTADQAGLSLDGPTPEVHDRFRSKRGNFARVFKLLDFLDRAGIPVIVRTVVGRPNFRQVADLGELLLPYGNVTFWHLLEFSAVGAGYQNRWLYELERPLFDDVVEQVVVRYGGKLKVHVLREEDKSGAYVLVTPDGAAYGTSDQTVAGVYPRVGSMLRDHLSDLAAGIRFRRELHEPRYTNIDAELRKKGEDLAKRHG
jgi:MoaA/NifB/PqqE/SkfB family radical SAM enzyme